MKRYGRGFTLIEVSLSLIFVSILALAIVLIITNAIGAYNRGLTINQINATGMELIDDFRLALQNSAAKTLTGTCGIVYEGDTASEEKKKCENEDAFKFVSVTKKTTMKINDQNYEVPIYGAFCSGTYSYIWNSGYYDAPDTLATFNEKSSKKWATLVYKTESGEKVTISSVPGSSGNKPFKLLKVKDTSRAVCISATENGKYALPSSGISNVFDITKDGLGGGTLEEDPEFLISTNTDSNLAIYELLIARPALSVEDNSLFYSGSFILGTIGGGINIMAKGKTCATPNDHAIENFDYCAINKFNFAVQASGE